MSALNHTLYAEVIPDVAARKLRGPLTYSVPENLAGKIEVGSCVLVPLRQRRVRGFVVGLSDRTEAQDVRPLLEIVEGGVAFDRAILSLAQWISETYLASLREAVRAVVPVQLPPKVRPPAEPWVHLAVSGEEARGIAEKLRSKASGQSRALAVLADRIALPKDELVRLAGADGRVIRRLQKRGLLTLEMREVRRRPTSQRAEALTTSPSPPLHLNQEQQRALEAIEGSLRLGRGEQFLLFGVAGSGKTEVYLKAIEAGRRLGLRSLVLVPEISLTPQVVERFWGRLQERVAIFHSGLTSGERYDEWRRIRAGEVDVVVGARSAVFAPLPNLGLVIVDEEHDPSYKQEQSPRYHAREAAMARGRISGATVVLGSTTPSVETFYRASVGELRLLRIAPRPISRPEPEITVVDMREKSPALRLGQTHARRDWIFSRPLEEAIRETLGRGEQVLLFINRRGYATSLLCRECGYVLRCPRCGVAMTYHLTKSSPTPRAVRCHYCNLVRPAPSTCPQCGGFHIRLLGIGTQRVEAEAKSRFPFARVARIDRDTVSRRGQLQAVLQAFQKGEVHLLVGTQMVAKDMDLPGVALAGVIAADQDLGLPDFRAAERTFQHLMQVARRVGREGLPGKVVIQTYNPRHFAIEAVRGQDYDRFYQEEIRLRQELRYPPFVHLINILVSHPRSGEAKRVAERLAAHLQGDGMEVLGPVPAPFVQIRGQYRWQVVCKVGDPKEVGELLEMAVEGERWPKEARISVDVDPVEML